MVIKYCVVCFSSSLDDLEVNSRSEGVLGRSNIPYPLLEHPEVKACSRDGLDSSEMNISRTESLPLSISPQIKVFNTVLVWIVFLLCRSLKTYEEVFES